MKYRPDIHHRRSIRLNDYDYSRAGLYFVTICCDDRKCRFGRIENGEMVSNEYGIIANSEWIHLTERFIHIEMDVFQIMPNHMHGIISIAPHENHGIRTIGAGASRPAPTTSSEIVGATLAVAPNTMSSEIVDATLAVAPNTFSPDRRVTVGDIVGAYKSLVANACLKIYKSNHQTMGKLWQSNYWEHIIRNEQELSSIRQYIKNNPIQWEYDQLNGGSGNQVLEPRTKYRKASWMV